jgi:MarR family multiple gene transcriptional regulator MgrA
MMDNRKLLEELSFNFYKSQRQVSHFYSYNILKDYDITYPQFLVLKLLWDNESVTVNEIVYALELNTGAVSPLLKRMEKLELIKKERSELDERKVIICLTDRGLTLKDDIYNAFIKIENALGLNIKEIEELNLLLNKVTESFKAEKMKLKE